MSKPIRRHRGARGAAAVEFALILPILITLTFGILQYGLWFNDSLNARQGVREAARQGVVLNFENPACSEATDMAQLGCITKDQIGALTGTEYVKVVRPPTWERAEPLIVCTLVKADGGVGILPLPNDGWISSTTQMSIEQDAEAPDGVTTQDTLPGDAPTAGYPC